MVELRPRDRAGRVVRPAGADRARGAARRLGARIRSARLARPARPEAPAMEREAMTALPPPPAKKLGLVIDLDTCVGCQACVTACKGWNDQGYGGPLSEQNASSEARRVGKGGEGPP